MDIGAAMLELERSSTSTGGTDFAADVARRRAQNNAFAYDRAAQAIGGGGDGGDGGSGGGDGAAGDTLTARAGAGSAAAAPELRSRIAARGDSWARIAREVYGDERYALALARANGASTTTLALGATVNLPELDGVNLRQGGRFIAADAASRAAQERAAAEQRADQADMARELRRMTEGAIGRAWNSSNGQASQVLAGLTLEQVHTL